MLTHVTLELPQVIEAADLPIVCSRPSPRPIYLAPTILTLLPQDLTRQSIFGHSMGGHGALTLYLNSVLSGRKQYRSASAFAPISNPTKCPWGEKAFKNYLQGGIDEAKDKYDATELIRKTNKEPLHILVDYVGHPRGTVCSGYSLGFGATGNGG